MTPPAGFVSVELLNVERGVTDDLRSRNTELKARIANGISSLKTLKRRDPAVYNMDNELSLIIDALGEKS